MIVAFPVIVAVLGSISSASAAAFPSAEIVSDHGAPTIMVDGKPLPPMTITLCHWNSLPPERERPYLQKLGEAGLKVHYVQCSTRWHNPGDPATGKPDGLEKALAAIRKLLDAIPDAYVMLRLNVSPPADWVNAHPEEQVTFDDGSHRKVICTSVGKEPLDGMHSLCSEKWMAEEDRAIADFFTELAKRPEAKHVIGTFLCAAGTGEWYYPQALVTDDGHYGDFSEPFRRFYSDFLRRKYKTVEELRRVWKRPDATFEKPLIPTVAERQFIDKADEKIITALRNWENADRVVGGMKLDMDAREATNQGVFLNANGYAHVADFYTAWHESTARTVVHFAKTLKKLQSKLLVGAFYGSYGCQSFFDGSTASGTLAILDSGAVDFLAAPGVYNNREPGGVVAQREMQDSFRLRNLIYICEDDSRTHLTGPWVQRDAMALYSVKDSIETLKRDFARDICEDIHGWWFDMGPGWYDDPEILALFKRQQEIAREAYSRDRTKRNDIALIYDVESVHHASQTASQIPLDFWRTTDLARIGAPVDYYFHNDLANPKMPDYRLYIMVNQYYLTDREREAVHAKARRNGATVLWLYAPGYIDPTAEKVMDVGNISKTVGMNVSLIDRTFFPHFRVDPAAHALVAGASASHRYGTLDRDLHSNIWIGPILAAPYLNPGFYVDDPAATVLGRYCRDGKSALAMTEKDGYRSVYCATPVVRSDLLASIASASGCHLYLKGDDVLYANENYVAIHASSDGRKTLSFKKRCSPYEVYERKYYGQEVDHIDIGLKLGETKMFRLDGCH